MLFPRLTYLEKSPYPTVSGHRQRISLGEVYSTVQEQARKGEAKEKNEMELSSSNNTSRSGRDTPSAELQTFADSYTEHVFLNVFDVCGKHDVGFRFSCYNSAMYYDRESTIPSWRGYIYDTRSTIPSLR